MFLNFSVCIYDLRSGTSNLTYNNLIIIIKVVTDVVQEQCEAEDDTSIQQRLLMGAATTIQGTGGALCEEGEGNEDMMIAGGMNMNHQ